MTSVNGQTLALILEDNPADMELIKRELRKGGGNFTFRWAKDESTFTHALDESVPDLILADYALPGFDALAALDMVRQRFGEVPVIIVSGAIGEETAIEALKAGATDYVLKDRLSRLGPVVKRALEEAKEMAERRRAQEALETARRQTDQALADSRILGRVAASVNQTLDLQKILDAALSGAMAALKFEHGCIYVFDDDGKLVIKAKRGLTPQFLKLKAVIGPGEGCAGEAAMTKEMFAPTTAERHFVCAESQELLGLDCLAAIPIVAGGESLGVLELFAPVARRLSTRERKVAKSISNLLATAVQNARLLEVERRISATLQESLLAMPEEISGIDLAHAYSSATAERAEVGGDFYDVFDLEYGRVGIIIGDVAGKGLEAATLTALVKNTIRAYAHQTYTPGAVVTLTNKMLVKRTVPAAFVTVFFGILNIESGVLRYCTAGHPPPILKTAAGALALEIGSPAIGIFPDLKFAEKGKVINRGEALILYTDGITEARRESELFGEERLIKLLSDSKATGAKKIAEKIFKAVMDFTGGNLADDTALLVISLSAAPKKD